MAQLNDPLKASINTKSNSQSKATSNALWGTRFGFYLAAVGSAFGLGNLWRFPSVTLENGGGAFVVMYIFFAILLGMPLLVGELMLGKLSRASAVKALVQVDSRRIWNWVAYFSIGTCFFISSYYAVVSGWVLHFLAEVAMSSFGSAFGGGFSFASLEVDKGLSGLRENASLQILFTSIHLLIALVIVAKGVQQGIERWIGNLMPIFLVLLIVLVSKTLSLPSAEKALRFLFYPDFSQISWSSPLNAIGHVLFTLSIGFGTMVTFGSYLKEDTHIPSAAFRVTSLDTMISVFAGLLIFPLLIDSQVPLAGPEILFYTLHRLWADFASGTFFGVTFFLCLYIAAMGATIGMLESLVANVTELTGKSRARSAVLVGVVTLAMALIPALAHTGFQKFQWLGLAPLKILDTVFVNVLLPISALGLCFAVSLRMDRDRIRSEFVNDDSIATQKLYSHWLFIITYFIPFVIFVSFAMAGFGLYLRWSS
jgi:neurotransmitter:Na+ symporter, NSS family